MRTYIARRTTGFGIGSKAKLRLETILEDLCNNTQGELDNEKKLLEARIRNLNKQIEAYSVKAGLASARVDVESTMCEVGEKLEFESFYKPINLKFSFETFELWHENEIGEKIYLRSMGSGANWLYSHVSLFLGLHKLFCQLGESCKIPPILFLDQPSQVYFPSVVDTGNDFDAQRLAEMVGKPSADDDVRAVTELYAELVRFCEQTARDTGLEPQIIVTDHADHLSLPEDAGTWESLVRDRWRTRGLMSLHSDV